MHELIFQMLKSTGLPVAYRVFPKNKAPKMPFVVFYSEGDNNFAADGKAYYTAHPYTIELYADKSGSAAETKIESVLDGSDFFYEKSEAYIEDESCYQIRYEIEV